MELFCRSGVCTPAYEIFVSDGDGVALCGYGGRKSDERQRQGRAFGHALHYVAFGHGDHYFLNIS